MTLIRSLTFSAGLLLSSSQIAAHEFWIEASKHYGESDETVALILKVGEAFRGSAQPLLPQEVERFVHISDKPRTINGLLGDSRPAARINIAKGLNQIIHLTTPFSIRFEEGDERWANYVKLDGLDRQINKYSNIPKIVPVTERYVRCAKSLVKTDDQAVSDSLSGEMPFEFVLGGSWNRLGVGHRVITVFEGQNPLANVLIKAFRYEDRSVVSQAYSDVNGRALLELPTADRYLISGVVIRPDDDPNYDWISYWPSITIEVIN